MSVAVLSVSNASKKMGFKKVVDSVNLQAFSGEIIGLLGANGAGKSTLLKMICGLYSFEGDISILGHSVRDSFSQAIENVGGFVDTPAFYPFMSGEQNLRYFASLSAKVEKRDIDAAVQAVRLASRIKDKVRSYSLGMRQRLALASSVLANPRLIVLDEPTNALDLEAVEDFKVLISTQARQNKSAVIISSHSLPILQSLCDRVAIMHKGQICAIYKKNGEQGQSLEEVYSKVQQTK